MQVKRFKVFSIFILLIIFQFVIVKKVFAQVVINEVGINDSPQWVELYSTDDMDISGWILKRTAPSTIYTIPSNTFIGPSSNKFFVANVSNILNDSGDTVYLYASDSSTLKDEIAYGGDGNVCLPGNGESIGRYPDGDNTIERLATETKGSSNSSTSLDACPTPTPTQAPTSSPAPTLTPESTDTPTPIPTDTPTKLITPTSQVEGAETQIGNDSGSSNNISDIRNSLNANDSSNSQVTVASEKTSQKFPIIAIVFIILGILFLATPLFIILKKRYNNKRNAQWKFRKPITR